MTFEEKSQWAYAVATFVTTAGYFSWLAAQLADEPVEAIGYEERCCGPWERRC